MTHSQILNASGNTIPKAQIDAIKMKSAFSGMGSSHRGASSSSQELAMLRTPTLSANAANRWDRSILSDRARHLVRNEATAGTAVRKSVGMGVGSGWRLQSRPDAYGLGISKEDARKLGKQIERAFKCWGDDPRKYGDATRHHNFGGQLRTLWGEWKTVNDVFVAMRYRRGSPSCFKTAVQILDADRVSNPSGHPDSEFLRDGIALDSFGAETGFHLRRGHPGDYTTGMDHMIWDFVAREDNAGRPIGIHGFRQQRAEESRGVTLFAPLIEHFVMHGKHHRAEIQSALLNAVMGAFVKSGFDPSAIAEVLGTGASQGDSITGIQDARMKIYDDHPVEFDGVRVPILAPGDDFSLNTTPRTASSFQLFNKIFNQLLAASLGLAEGQVSGDYTGLNYSTLRGAYNEVYNDIFVDRADFGDQIVKPVFLCVLEEAIEIGQVAIPEGCADLWDEPAAWTKSNWVGPARGHIDPEKEAKGDILSIEAGLSSRTRIAAARGQDLEELVAEQAEEQALYEEYKVDPTFRDGALAPTPSNSVESPST